MSKRNASRQWIKLVVIEPHPVFLFDPRFTVEQQKAGPHYSAGATFYDVPANRPHLERSAQAFRGAGYTAIVLDEVRS
jgi:hypothetical protein